MRQILKAAISKLVIFFYASLLCSTVVAQGVDSVVESQAFTPAQSSSSAAGNNNDALLLLLDQIRDLQGEVQALRAMVEEQNFEVRKIQRDSLSRYTNVDERLSGLESGANTPATNIAARTIVSDGNIPATNIATRTIDSDGNIPATNIATRTIDSDGNTIVTPANATPALNQPSISNTAPEQTTPVVSRPPSTRNIGRGTLEPVVLSEQQLYQMAYNSVIKSNFDLSIAEFNQYLSIYPQGRFVANAHYWKGQAYLYLNRYTEAVESYEIILNQAEESAKLQDAMYGLALAYEGLGNIPQAKQLLNNIKRRFPNTGVANLADTRLLSID